MIKVHLVMPMGGAGSRFALENYELPKPLIKINDKPFFYWATMSIIKDFEVADVIFVVLEQHVKKYCIDEEILSYFPHAKIVVIPHVLDGPVLTSLKAVDYIEDSLPIIFNDCDHMFRCTALANELKNNDSITVAGGLLTFQSSEPQFSYVKYKNGKIIGTVEKQVVSDRAICGAYFFKNKGIFENTAEMYLNDCQYKEYYMSGLYNIMIKNGGNVSAYDLDFHVEYGTPKEFSYAQNSHYFEDFR